MKTIKKITEENYPTYKEKCAFTYGVYEAQKWFNMNELKEIGVDVIFKKEDGKCAIGKLEFIEGKLCISTDTSYSILEDSGFICFRPLNRK